MHKSVAILVLFIAICVYTHTREILILHTNDHHGSLFPYQEGHYEVAGLAERASVISSLTKDTDNFLILDAGDINSGQFESLLFDAEPDIKAYNLIGYHAMTLGNHEFYGGIARLKKQATWANFPFLSANITDASGKHIVEPFLIKQMPNGLNVAIFGLTTATLRNSLPDVSDDIVIHDEFDTARELIPRLREQADIVIALTHLGIAHPPTPSRAPDHSSIRLARTVPGIDLIIDGHTHALMPTPLIINGVPIVSAGDRGKYIGKAKLHFDDVDKIVRLKDWESISLMKTKNGATSERQNQDSAIATLLQSYIDRIPEMANEVIGQSDMLYTIENIRTTQTPLGGLITESMILATRQHKPDFAVTNSGGIRANLPQGSIKLGDVYRVLPFDNTIVIVDITGQALLDIVNQGQNMATTGGFLQYSSHVELIIDPPTGRWSAKINGITIIPDRVYRVAANSFLVAGGDRYTQWENAINIIDTDIIQKNALAGFIKYF
jgi:5'-nucleotidase/UDP-sugar diphosphatase